MGRRIEAKLKGRVKLTLEAEEMGHKIRAFNFFEVDIYSEGVACFKCGAEGRYKRDKIGIHTSGCLVMSYCDRANEEKTK